MNVYGLGLTKRLIGFGSICFHPETDAVITVCFQKSMTSLTYIFSQVIQLLHSTIIVIIARIVAPQGVAIYLTR